MKRSTSLLISLLLFAVSGFYISTSFAEDAQEQLDAASIIKKLDSVELELDREKVQVDKLNEYMVQLPGFSSWSRNCVQSTEKELDNINGSLVTLGDTVKGESEGVAKKRESLLNQKSNLDKKLASCRVIVLRSDEAISNINKIKQALLAEELLAKGPDFFDLLQDNWQHPALWIDATKTFILENSGLDLLSYGYLLLLLFIVGASGGIGFYFKQLLKRLENKRLEESSQTGEYIYALSIAAQRYLPYLLASISAAIYVQIVTRDATPTPFVSILLTGLPVILLLMSMIHFYLRVSLKSGVIDVAQEKVAKSLARRLKVLVALIFIGYLLFSTIVAQSLPESALHLARTVYAGILLLNLVWIFWLIGRFNKETGRFLFRFIVTTLFAGVFLADLLGYRNLALYIFRVSIGTLLSLGIFRLLSERIKIMLEGLEHGKTRWQQKIHSLVGVKKNEPVPGLFWMRFTAALLIWSGFLITLMFVWDVPDSYIQIFSERATVGFNIGSFEIRPIQIIEAILVLTVLLTINGWFRKRLEQRWLAKTSIERGARESMVAITGYVGMAIAVILALSVAGMDFSKLAIIAGALSVGIGFGLQNIVNNFISGLILLFERPVKTGDWVVVGAVEGYVKKISIRSTQIQTFDRADIIVPNSELISGNVTNLMLHDMRGRIKVPVGVAYGSDTAKVKDILLKIANEHPQVVTGGVIDPEPKVMFLGFGDSSLNFELRCYIENIDKRLSTISDINFAIDAAFRENGVEIPFPQRDIHVRNLPDQSQSDTKGNTKSQD
jgi:potassium-dependent mechanosensitive channel